MRDVAAVLSTQRASAARSSRSEPAPAGSSRRQVSNRAVSGSQRYSATTDGSSSTSAPAVVRVVTVTSDQGGWSRVVNIAGAGSSDVAWPSAGASRTRTAAAAAPIKRHRTVVMRTYPPGPGFTRAGMASHGFDQPPRFVPRWGSGWQLRRRRACSFATPIRRPHRRGAVAPERRRWARPWLRSVPRVSERHRLAGSCPWPQRTEAPRTPFPAAPASTAAPARLSE